MDGRGKPHILIGASLLGAVAAAAQGHMIPTIYSSAHRRTKSRRIGNGGRAPFATPEYAERYQRRRERYARKCERTGNNGEWPAHLRGDT